MILLQFEGEDSYFENPVKLIQANRADEVVEKLREVEQAVAMGYYAVGYMGYEAAAAFYPEVNVKAGAKMPLLWFAIFADKSEMPTTSSFEQGDFKLGCWLPETDYAGYKKGFDRIKKEIEEGNTYQVNSTIRLRATFTGNSFSFYEQLTKAQKSKYSAYINAGQFHILSVSPELFFKLKDGVLTARPMKGTTPWGNSEEEYNRNKDWLFQSEKNRSENLMIVDLLRNDLGRIAEVGSVTVPRLFEIEEYSTVLQMTSTVTAKMAAGTDFVKLFSALFPCGSITGAPKLSTMNIISEIEDSPREVYCGALGYFAPNGDAVFNVPIRTCWIDSLTGIATYGVGGGITWDSEVDDEFDECFIKAKILTQLNSDFQLLETIRLENGQFYLLQEHLNRLANSAAFFQVQINLVEVENTLQQYAQTHSSGLHKVRLLVSKEGSVSVESTPIEEIAGVKSVSLATHPIISRNNFLYHKTTNRQLFEPYKKEGFFDCLLWNERGELTEFTTGNLVLQIDGEMLTPPVSCGLLPGVMRGEQLAKGELREQVLRVEDLQRATNVWFINSVRGRVEVCVER